jgi:putative peptide zinc metalloprotease protein
VHSLALTRVDPARQHRIIIPEPGGFLERLEVRDGQHVRKGDILAVLRNPDLEMRLRLNVADQSLRRQQQRAAAAQLRDAPGLAVKVATIDDLEHELAALARQEASWKAQAALLTLRAPDDGTVLRLPSWESKGKWLEGGEQLCVVADAGELRALIVLEAHDRQLIAEGQTVRFLAHGRRGTVHEGTIDGIAQVNAEEIPPQLSNRVGGEVATRHDAAAGTEKPYRQHFLVTVRLRPSHELPHPGTLGQVRIDAGSETLWWRVRRFLASTFHWNIF